MTLTERIAWRLFDALADLVMRSVQHWPPDIDDDPEEGTVK